MTQTREEKEAILKEVDWDDCNHSAIVFSDQIVRISADPMGGERTILAIYRDSDGAQLWPKPKVEKEYVPHFVNLPYTNMGNYSLGYYSPIVSNSGELDALTKRVEALEAAQRQHINEWHTAVAEKPKANAIVNFARVDELLNDLKKIYSMPGYAEQIKRAIQRVEP